MNIIRDWRSWTRWLALALVVSVGINVYGWGVYGWGMHKLMEIDSTTYTLPAVYGGSDLCNRQHDWAIGGSHPGIGEELYITVGVAEDGTYVRWGNVDLSNMGPITFDGTDRVPFYDDDGFEEGTQ